MEDFKELEEKLNGTNISKYDLSPYIRNIQNKVLELITAAISNKNEQVKNHASEVKSVKKEFENYKALHKLINENEEEEEAIVVRRTLKIGDTAFYITKRSETKHTFKICPVCKGKKPTQRKGFTHKCNNCNTWNDEIPEGHVVDKSTDVTMYSIYETTVTGATIHFIPNGHYFEEFKDSRPIQRRMHINDLQRITATTLYNVKKAVEAGMYSEGLEEFPEHLIFKTKKDAQEHIKQLKANDRAPKKKNSDPD